MLVLRKPTQYTDYNLKVRTTKPKEHTYGVAVAVKSSSLKEHTELEVQTSSKNCPISIGPVRNTLLRLLKDSLSLLGVSSLDSLLLKDLAY